MSHASPGHSKPGQDERFHCVYSIGHRLQFPSLPPRRHPSVVVLLSCDCVSRLTRLWSAFDPCSLDITSRPRVNSSAWTLSPSLPYLRGSLSRCLDCRQSEPTISKPSLLPKTHTGSTETKCVTFPVPPSTDGLLCVWNFSVHSSFCVLRCWPLLPL